LFAPGFHHCKHGLDTPFPRASPVMLERAPARAQKFRFSSVRRACKK
jgi:hypothetical protein